MLRYLPVRKVHARQVLDSRGNPTVEVTECKPERGDDLGVKTV